MLTGTEEVIGSRLEQYKSQEGHIVIRVYGSGEKYDLYVLDDTSENREVKIKFGPYASR